MSKHSKRFKAATLKVEAKTYALEEAVKLLALTSNTKFDSSVEIHIKLGIDPKKGEQAVRGSVVMPNGTGKKIRIAAFVTPDKESEAKKSGADLVGGAELIENIKKDEKCNFDVAIAVPGIMKELAAIARILGQRGLMPNPKTGTVSENVATAIESLRKGQVTFRNDDTANVHAMVGKVSLSPEMLAENIVAFMEAVKRAKPEGLKGSYIQRVFLATSMGPSIKVSLS